MPVDPSACRYCLNGERTHYTRWTLHAGWHQWTEPTWPQRRQRILNNLREAREQRVQRQLEHAFKSVLFVWDSTDTRGDAAMDAWRKAREGANDV